MSAGEPITAFPATWLERLAGAGVQRASSSSFRWTLNVAGYSVEVDIRRDELTQVYLPTLHILQASLGNERRIVAGLAGIPGGGKSTFAAVLARLADALWGMGRLAVVGMDGWHWPNDVLDSRTTTDEAGNVIPLRQRKGGPESYDIDAIAAAISELKPADRPMLLPVYDRRIHDPVPDRLAIGPGTTILLMEGNFLLDPDRPWDTVSSLLHPKLFIECSVDIARQRILARHIRGGATPDEASRKYDSNDRMNTDEVLATAVNADCLIRFEPTLVVRKIRRGRT